MRKQKKVDKAQQPYYIHVNSTQSFTCLLVFQCYVMKNLFERTTANCKFFAMSVILISLFFHQKVRVIWSITLYSNFHYINCFKIELITFCAKRCAVELLETKKILLHFFYHCCIFLSQLLLKVVFSGDRKRNPKK